MERFEMKAAKLLVGTQGGDLRIVTPDGEIFAEIGLMPGIHEASEYMAYVLPGYTVEVGPGVTAMQPPSGRNAPIKYGADAYKSGANPDWEPTVATRQQRQMEMTLAKINAKSKALDKKFAAMEELHANQRREEVIDDETQEETVSKEEQTEVETETKEQV
ncbi:hypothetical protein RUESEDTHA_03602 [Ruegeria sp. THAF57]|uniref:hypothetical protein n=1 Tax=Ruegeria sp. THAF57 TaxID=2744555 RepID=UPI0015DE32D0|nr:hypothetical protein [Ruegeria sp. THAF57]CAD0186692.1 hypothetical protein RUESEDTHA_03602 [Ruegeria sp. THAF57]